MRPIPILVLVAATGAASAQQLSCPPSSNLSGRACETFHFHVQMYRPETKSFIELYGINQFASQPACDHAREAQMARNLAVVDYIKRVVNDQQYQPDRFGTCHCDMTTDKSNPNFLTDLQRTAQLRMAEEIRQRVRERLLSQNVTSDSELIRGLSATPSPASLLAGPRLVPLPPPQVVSAVSNSVDDLKSVKVAENSAAPNSIIDLPLIDILDAPPTAMAAASTPPLTASPAATPAPTTAPAAPTPAPLPASEPAAATAAPAPDPLPKAEENVPTAEESADSFISYETQRIQNVLKASSAITDEGLKSKILESCMQRIQLLSNLRTLIQGSGARSRLATAARSSRGEPERLSLVSKLFGADMPPHWAPKDASDVVLPPMLAEADPEKVLRDSSGKFSSEQKKHALYALLSHSQPTEEQQLWLTTVVDTFLQ